MHIATKLSAAALMATSLALAAAAPSAASSTVPVAGRLLPTSATFYPKPFGPNLIIGFKGTHAWTGGFTGAGTIVGFLLERPSGAASFEAVGTFTGDTPCGPATVGFVTSGSGQLPFQAGHAFLFGIDDHSAFVRASLDVSLVLDPTTGATVDYVGDVHCR